MIRSPLIAVLDIGKTNLKLLVASEDGWPLETHSIPNVPNTAGPYLAYDLAGLEEWFLDTLAVVTQRHTIGAVITTAHGCGAVLVDGEEPVLPMMDYDAIPPPAIDEAYAQIAPGYDEAFCGIAGAMRLGKQLLWQEHAYPVEFARAKTYLTTAQFFALRLGGRAASEISQLAAQSHIWDLIHHRPSSLMCHRGWSHLLPDRVPAGAVLGTVSESVARRTGLARSTEILCGVHDSNANLFRYKAAGMADASILSTGTWMIGFQRGLPLDKLNCARAMVLNIDVDGENAPSTLIATGREYDLIRGRNCATDAAVLAALPTLLSRRTLALPSFVDDDGLFPGAARRGRVIGPPPETPAEMQALAVLYAAFSANRCLDALESSKRIIIDGGFAANLPFARCLASLRPSQSVWVSQSPDGTALGAALLWRRFSRTLPVSSVALEAVTSLGNDGFELRDLSAAYQSWIAFSEPAL
ncbi:carbohydrate kinase [Bradyrhizobium sp. WYCCWR 13023]|uniref:Carbohydrate kinase n=1 Tax=Bradyrhizobium zhengyangense TaxID=2911009 RepID=A0A9X1R818_9BRAD|nr:MULTISPECIES: FGGY-family carbohydrate kinase [Bradyrhizobium]MCG2626228.1 carbohydrate kinase [Bradyrhizobium zhengyangense]MCG2644761.1 carbohydrate kinase [Bradyrhizobium zhengyangense]MCG2668234.1 carbohydrate kinase [Bradyrhizobium zhengyangense]MDA9524461.1 carbohydrate kinase [Bradyrhizobium sp. CCBAU 11434]